MAYDRPTIEPSEHEAGTTLSFQRDFTDYPADAWELTYNLVNTTGYIDTITATADGTTHVVTVAYATTADWPAGEYRMKGYVTETGGDEKYPVYDGWITINPYIGDAMPADTRSYWRKVRDNVRDAILSSASSDVVSYSINGRSFTKAKTDALSLLHMAEAKVRWEEHKGRQRKILVKFSDG